MACNKGGQLWERFAHSHGGSPKDTFVALASSAVNWRRLLVG